MRKDGECGTGTGENLNEAAKSQPKNRKVYFPGNTDVDTLTDEIFKLMEEMAADEKADAGGE